MTTLTSWPWYPVIGIGTHVLNLVCSVCFSPVPRSTHFNKERGKRLTTLHTLHY